MLSLCINSSGEVVYGWMLVEFFCNDAPNGDSKHCLWIVGSRMEADLVNCFVVYIPTTNKIL